MPIYEYRCSACGHELEALQKITDTPLSNCPACHADTLKKLVSAAGFQLKGSGWYATDFRNGSKPAAKPGTGDAKTDAKVDGKPDGKSEGKSESGTDSKPAETKAAAKSEAAAPVPATGSTGSTGH